MRQAARERGNRNPFLVPRARRFLVTWSVTKMPSEGRECENPGSTFPRFGRLTIGVSAERPLTLNRVLTFEQTSCSAQY